MMQALSSINLSDLRALATFFPGRHRSAALSALRSESYRLNQVIRGYAKSKATGWRFSPVTKLLRKGQGYGPWLARYTRYYVDEASFTAYAGVLGKNHTGFRTNARGNQVRRFSPISGQFVASAARLASGYTMFISGKQQRRMAAKLLNPGAKHFGRVRTIKGAIRKWNAIHQAIPRAGFRRVAARPVVGPVFQMERERTVRNVRTLYLVKMMGRRYAKSWANDWGNA